MLGPFILSLGFVCGIFASMVLVFLWVSYAGPVQEWLCERFLDPRHPKGPVTRPLTSSEGPVSIVISDVHLDTWNYESGRPAAFAAFLEALRADRRVTDLYVNGDIMDMPPHPLNQRDVQTLVVDPTGKERYPDVADGPLGVLLPPFDKTLEALSDIVKRDETWPVLRVTYLTGNHDIGVAGVRFIRPELAWSALRVAWNPSVLVRQTPERAVYIEHGHRYDPYLWVYLRYAVLELLRGPGAARPAQRGGKVGMNPKPEQAAGEAPTLHWEGKEEIYPEPKEPFKVKLARYRYRHAARVAFRRAQREHGASVKVVTFGHTHIPDRYEFPGGRLYVNSGDWAGNGPHQCYVVIRPDGTVTGPHQWRTGTELRLD